MYLCTKISVQFCVNFSTIMQTHTTTCSHIQSLVTPMYKDLAQIKENLLMMVNHQLVKGTHILGKFKNFTQCKSTSIQNQFDSLILIHQFYIKDNIGMKKMLINLQMILTTSNYYLKRRNNLCWPLKRLSRYSTT